MTADPERPHHGHPTGTETGRRPVSRRSWLGAVGSGAVGLGALALAGCGTSSSRSAATTAPGTTPAATSGPTAASAGPRAASAGSAAGPGAMIVALSDVPVGGSVAATIDGRPALLSQPAKGTIRAFSAICTHQGCTVAPTGSTLSCPCHGSVFDAFTGAVEQGPAPSPLPPISVRVSGDSVVAG